jgi:tetratricopeptide (TPR) repeat protein
MTPLKKIYLLSSVLIFLVTGCATSAGKGSIFPMVGADPINRYPIDDNQIKEFGSSIRAVQGEPQAKYDLARHFQRMQKHRIAIEALKEIIQMEPDHADAHNALGYSYDSLGEYAKAQTHYRVAMRLDPEMHYAFNNMGYSLILDGNYTAAVEVLKQAVALKRDDPKYHRNLGLAYLKSGDLQMAVNEFNGQAKAIDNEKAETLPTNKEERSTSGELLEEGLFETGILASRTERIKPAPVETGQDPILIGNVEVSNGNGVSGMARRLGRHLAREGFRVGRLTNADHFGYRQTIVFHSKGTEDRARLIADALPRNIQVPIVELNDRAGHIQVRIGSDMVF